MMPVAGQDMANVSPVFPGYPPTQNMTYPTRNSYPSPYSNFHYPPQIQGYQQPQYLPQQNFASQPQSPSQSMYPSLSHYPTEPRQFSSQSHFQSHSHLPSSQYFNSRVQVVRSSAQWSAGLGLSSKLLQCPLIVTFFETKKAVTIWVCVTVWVLCDFLGTWRILDQRYRFQQQNSIFVYNSKNIF